MIIRSFSSTRCLTGIATNAASSKSTRTRVVADPSEPVLVLALAAAGQEDPATGIRGWHQKADVGIKSLGNGLFYLSADSTVGGLQTSDVELCYWTGSPNGPFEIHA
jgi:hypothetical protein